MRNRMSDEFPDEFPDYFQFGNNYASKKVKKLENWLPGITIGACGARQPVDNGRS